MEISTTNNNLIQNLPYELIHIIFILLDLESQLNLMATANFFIHCKEFLIIDKMKHINNFHVNKINSFLKKFLKCY